MTSKSATTNKAVISIHELKLTWGNISGILNLRLDVSYISETSEAFSQFTFASPTLDINRKK
jgi:hypothetical protein